MGMPVPAGHQAPEGHSRVQGALAPTTGEYVPIPQGVGAEDPDGQNEPRGHTVAVPVLLQKYPAAHALHVILRTAWDGLPSATYTLP